MKPLFILGRVLFALIFLIGAPRHFTAEGIHHAAELGVPLAQFFVPASGVLAILGALSVATGFRTAWGAWALVLFLIPVTFDMHSFWAVTDESLRHVQQAMFAKNLSMLGAALMLANGSNSSTASSDNRFLRADDDSAGGPSTGSG